MPDPSGFDPDPSATRLGDDPDPTRVESVEESAADAIEATEIDPYATALPPGSTGTEAYVPAAPEATVDDPYSTRFSMAATGSWNSVVAEPWSESGGQTHSVGGTRASRYHPLRLHARGGLGEIFVAVDGELNREVALKEIQHQHGDKYDSQYRFVFEAEITGGLEHPGIVPVYGLGRYADGRPYYAMRFIRGDSLKAAIKHFHDDRKAQGVGSNSTLGHSFEFRRLIARFVAVCQAIDYAHSRQVLHRDIKPDNIMLGPYGETLVVDWGLAKAMDRPEPVEPTAPRPLRPLSGSDTSATMAGSVMGTPAYMSPEQANGDIETLGPPSDIFSLGSTLHALLTGHGPFRQKSLHDLLEFVKRAEFPSPRSAHPEIPRPLEAICLKAMARLPADRYPTAAALGADLERWLSDEPVEAYPEPWPARVSRWARRHKTTVAVAFALLLSISTALAIGTVLIGREQARTERNFQRARGAVEQMLDRVGEVDLADVPQMEMVRQALLERALGFYREFQLERGSTSALETGRALVRLGEIREMLGQYVQAEADDREALKILQGVGGDPQARRALARGRTSLGLLLKKSNRFVESESVLRQALLDRQALVDQAPDDVDGRRALATTRYQLATLLSRLANRSQEDEATYRQAIQEQRALANRPTPRPEDRRDLARSLNNLGILQAGADPDAAEKTFLEAMKLQDELQATSANNAGFRWQRARTWNNLANLYAKAQLAKDAEAAFAQARTGFEALAADFPRVPDYRRELAMTLNNLAQIVEATPSGDLDPLALLRRALEDQKRLVQEFPEVPDHRMKQAITLMHLGECLRPSAPLEAEAALGDALQLQRTLVANHPEVPEYQATLGRTLTARGMLRAAEGHQDQALESLDQAIEALDKARASNPRDLTYVRFLFDARDDRGRVLVKLARHADLAREASKIAELAPDRPEGHRAAAGFLARCFEIVGGDTTLDDSRKRELRETYARDCQSHLKRAIDQGDPDPTLLDAPDFQPLKGRPDFEKLREDWQASGRKAVG